MNVKKIVAPLIITILVVIYLAIYFGALIWIIPYIWLKVLLAVLPIALAGTMIYVCIQRINEIRSGEEDDLSKY